MFTKNQTFTLVTDDSQKLTYTIKDIGDTGKLLVHSSLLEKAYFVSPEAFEDFLKVIGYEEGSATKYKIWLTNYNRYFGPDDSYNSFNDALETGKMSGANFQIRLGEMICATWVPIGGLEFTEEYKSWYQENERKEEGSAKYRIYYINHQYYSEVDFDYINRAIEYGKEKGFEFRVELGSMICCAWDAIGGLRFYAEYQLWKRDQEMMLGKVEGSYE